MISFKCHHLIIPSDEVDLTVLPLITFICGIRALQKEMGARRLIDTLQWMMLERYLG